MVARAVHKMAMSLLIGCVDGGLGCGDLQAVRDCCGVVVVIGKGLLAIAGFLAVQVLAFSRV